MKPAALLLPLMAFGLSLTGKPQSSAELWKLVNPFVGTSGTDQANGHTFPGATLPFGMLQWSPDTISGFIPGHAGSYLYDDDVIRGFSLNHLSGPGCFVFGDVPVLPVNGAIRNSPAASADKYTARFSHRDEIADAGFYSVKLGTGIETELTATIRSGQARFTFPTVATSTILVGSGSDSSKVTDGEVRIIGNRELAGWVTDGNFCGRGNKYTVYFAAEFDRPFDEFGTWQGADLLAGSRMGRGDNSGAFVSFNTAKNRIVQMKTAISYVSVENAWLNLQTENAGWNFELARRRAEETWQRELASIEVADGSTEERRVFYTALYHALLQPNIFNDVNGEYIGFDGKKHTVKARNQYANFSGWDMYRSQIQLLALLHPKETGDMIQSLVADQQQGGGLPRWPLANDDTCSMVGDPDDLIIAGASAFGAVGFDKRAALDGMLKDATLPGVKSRDCVVRPGLREYLSLGYLSPDSNSGPSETLEFAAGDFAIAQFAKGLGDHVDEITFSHRGQFWKNIFNERTGYIEPRHNDGTYFPNLDPSVEKYNGQGKAANRYRWVEGNAAQYSWMVPYNFRALFEKMGGNEKVIARLNEFFTKLNVGSNEPYFWMGNEPLFSVPWAYDFAGAPWRTQAIVRRIETELYTSKPDGLPGNDDLGATSAWYVFAAAGLYPAVPAVGGLCVDSPLFGSLRWELGGGKTLEIIGLDAARANPFVQGLTVNGKNYDSSWIPYSEIANGARLVFRLGARPNETWANTASARPPSWDGGQ